MSARPTSHQHRSDFHYRLTIQQRNTNGSHTTLYAFIMNDTMKQYIWDQHVVPRTDRYYEPAPYKFFIYNTEDNTVIDKTSTTNTPDIDYVLYFVYHELALNPTQIVDEYVKRMEAVAMMTHRRLGSDSPGQRLSSESLNMIYQHMCSD
jgi:hypothetical protein